jgi:hypothetical protein
MANLLSPVRNVWTIPQGSQEINEKDLDVFLGRGVYPGCLLL